MRSSRALPIVASLLAIGVGSASATPTPTGGSTKLVINDNAAPAKRKAVFVTKDVTVTIPSPDPATTGATMQLLNPSTGETSSIWSMPASGWTCTVGKVCKYADKTSAHGPVLSAVLKPGDGVKKSGLFKAVVKGAALDYALIGQGTQGHVGVVVDIGSGGVCTLVPEQAATAKKDDPVKGGFTAARTKGVPADASCPAVTVPTTTTTATTTTVTTTTLPLATVALGGCTTSGYVAPVSIGTQTFDLIADSGSSTLAVASTGCPSCTGVSPLYSPGASAMDLGTTTSATYGDGSGWNAEVFSDLVSPSGPATSVQMDFGAIKANLNGFFGPASCKLGSENVAYQGIWGLAGPGLLEPGTDSYLDKLAVLGTFADVFSVRLCTEGGTLWLGGYDGTAVTAPPSYTPMVPDTTLDAVTLSAVTIGGSSVTVNGHAIVDTGTTSLVLPTNVFNAIANTVGASPTFTQNFTGGSSWFTNGGCSLPAQAATKAELDGGLPTLTLTFPSPPSTTFTVDLPATESYLLQTVDSGGNVYYCPGIADGGVSLAIVGAAAMQSLITVFDRQNQRIGFAPGQGCPVTGSAVRQSRSVALPQTVPAPPYRRHVEVR